MTMLNIKKFC